MPFNIPNAVHETTTTSGTGSLTVAGAVADRLAFSSQLANGDTTIVCTTDGTDWEIAKSTFTSPSTLSRDSVIWSTNGNALVNWPASGTRDVFVAPAGEELASLIDPSKSAGILVKTADRTYATRSIDVDTDYFLITNPAGTAGNPTLGSAYTVTAEAKQILDDTSFAAIRSTLGLTALSTLATGSEGEIVRVGPAGPVYAKPYYGALVYHNATQTHNSTGGWVDLFFNSESHDSGTIHDTGVNTELFAVPSWATKARVNAHIVFVGNTTGVRRIRFATEAGAALTPGIQAGRTVTGQEASYNTELDLQSGIFPVTGGSNYKFQYYQDSGGNLNIAAEASAFIEFFP